MSSSKKIPRENLQEVTLVLDTREKEDVRQAFIEGIQSFDVVEKQCSVGDMWIGRPASDGDIEPLVVFERKTWNDYLSSLESGRLTEQRSRLLKTGHRCVFLIEGRRNALVGYKRRDRVQCEAFLDYSQVRDGIAVWFTDTLDESILRINRLMSKMRDRTFLEEKGGAKSFADCQKLEKKTGLTYEECYLAQLAQIPKVTVPFARKVLEHYRSFPELCTAIVTDRTEVIRAIGDLMLTEKRRYGYVCSARFVQYVSGEIHDTDTQIKKKKVVGKKRSRAPSTSTPSAQQQQNGTAKRRKTTMEFSDDDDDDHQIICL